MHTVEQQVAMVGDEVIHSIQEVTEHDTHIQTNQITSPESNHHRHQS